MNLCLLICLLWPHCTAHKYGTTTVECVSFLPADFSKIVLCKTYFKICHVFEKNNAIIPNFLEKRIIGFTSVQFSCSVMSDSLQPHELQHARPPCPSPTPGVHPASCPLSQWCHPTVSSSVIPFSSCPQSFPASGSFPMIQLFSWGGQSIGVSASTSVLPVNTQDWSPYFKHIFIF